MKKSFIELEQERMEWSLKIFDEATAESSLIKCEEEIEEIRKDLLNGTPKAEEYVDAIMCLFDSARRAGFDVHEMRDAYEGKNQKNIHERKWFKNHDNTYSHYKKNNFIL